MGPSIPSSAVGYRRVVLVFADEDYHAYLRWLEEYARKSRCRIHAYVLMTNHVHLLMTPATVSGASGLMKQLGQHYVQYVNRTYRRSGTLWEGRFRSCVVGEEDYLLACHSYIELNPIRARIVDHPAEYPWSSYRTNGQGQPSTLLTPHPLYTALGRNDEARQTAYREIFRCQLDPGTIDEIRAATNGNYALGSTRFQAQVAAVLGRRVTPEQSGRPRKRRVGLAGPVRWILTAGYRGLSPITLYFCGAVHNGCSRSRPPQPSVRLFCSSTSKESRIRILLFGPILSRVVSLRRTSGR